MSGGSDLHLLTAAEGKNGRLSIRGIALFGVNRSRSPWSDVMRLRAVSTLRMCAYMGLVKTTH